MHRCVYTAYKQKIIKYQWYVFDQQDQMGTWQQQRYHQLLGRVKLKACAKNEDVAVLKQNGIQSWAMKHEKYTQKSMGMTG